jgi:hypothetical protein
LAEAGFKQGIEDLDCIDGQVFTVIMNEMSAHEKRELDKQRRKQKKVSPGGKRRRI